MVGVVYLHVEQGFDAAARLFGVRLRAHTGDAQGKGFERINMAAPRSLIEECMRRFVKAVSGEAIE